MAKNLVLVGVESLTITKFGMTTLTKGDVIRVDSDEAQRLLAKQHTDMKDNVVPYFEVTTERASFDFSTEQAAIPVAAETPEAGEEAGEGDAEVTKRTTRRK